MTSFQDQRGDEIAVGDRVFSVGIDYGVPMWATTGTVIALARTRVRVQWDQYGYDVAQPFHAAVPSSIRRMAGLPAQIPDYYAQEATT